MIDNRLCMVLTGHQSKNRIHERQTVLVFFNEDCCTALTVILDTIKTGLISNLKQKVFSWQIILY